ncbi:MAG: class I SAM-dependent methyltransferase [Fimbriimonas ginsengisoli]|nr:class I SAM-dependent methyltransferase [Candidatus Kaiserbacteria bacterium]MBI3721357.1 class I SAM-dependent methyltransferase [Fimbriimonas ginsengisoli]
MELHSHSDIAALEKDNWWYVVRRQLLLNLLAKYARASAGGVALDLGCGVGANYDVLAPYAARVIGVDIAPEALAYARARGYAEALQAKGEHLPLQDHSVTLALCADILEHLDDTKAVPELRRVLMPGGIVVATVPAFPSLWNENDDYSHHLRRYRRGELRKLFAKSGFILRASGYWNALLFVPVWIMARFYRRRPNRPLRNNLSLVPRFLNGALTRAALVEQRLHRFLPLPFGVSEVLVCEAPA